MRTFIFATAVLIAVELAILLVTGASNRKDVVTPSPVNAIEAQQGKPQPTPEDSVRRVTVEELRAALEKGKAIVVDVRGQEAYKIAHIKGALSIPEADLKSRLGELPKDKLIVFYCS
jgi:glucose/arabinose dehydrogenase